MPQLESVLTSLMQQKFQSDNFDFGEGRAPMKMRDRNFKWRPRDKDPLAIPYATSPSDSIAAATLAAMNALCADDVSIEFERGSYWIDGTWKVAGGSTSAQIGSKVISFNNTEIRTKSSYPETKFESFRSRNDYTKTLGNDVTLNSTGTNLPAPVDVKCLMDITNTVTTNYTGLLTLNGGNRTNIAALGATNYDNTSGSQRSIWGGVEIINSKYGLFGTPRYNSGTPNLAAAFVNHRFEILRFGNTVDFPLLIGGNQSDGLTIGILSMNKKESAISYLYNAPILAEQIYVVSGALSTDNIFDIQKSHLTFGELYCEGSIAQMIIARNDSWVEGRIKGTDSCQMGNKCYIYSLGVNDGGKITLHQDNANNIFLTTAQGGGAVKLRSVTNSKRNYDIAGPTSETVNQPFVMEADGGTTLSVADTLTARLNEGLSKWVPGGTSAAPTLTRRVPTYT